ncbi:hypothetical protein [Halopelagius fulvigenes]|uniref:Uncharacterized protein n=1 Tax=Halopelagius fulvigenes TaxID=1198324 RepID=A0ABD5TYI2_9EURY
MPADDYLDATTAAFVGVFVAGLFGFAALLAYVAAGDLIPAVRALSGALAGLGVVFLLLSLAAAALLAR